MRQFSFISPVVALALVGTASAQSAISVTTRGDIVLGYGDHAPGGEFYLYGDADLALSFGKSPVQLELGLYGAATESDTPHETYGAVALNLGADRKITAGVPRPAYDSFARSDLERHFPLLALDRTLSSRAHVTYGSMFESELQYGIRYEAAPGALSYAVSVHTVPDSDTDSLDIGLGYSSGTMGVSAALEYVEVGGTSSLNAKLQARATVQDLEFAVGYFHPDSRDGPDLYEARVTLAPSGPLALTAIVQEASGAAGDPIFGLSADRMLNDRVRLHGGIARDADGDAAIDLGFGYRF